MKERDAYIFKNERNILVKCEWNRWENVKIRKQQKFVCSCWICRPSGKIKLWSVDLDIAQGWDVQKVYCSLNSSFNIILTNIFYRNFALKHFYFYRNYSFIFCMYKL